MALIKCPECGEEISDQAISCPKCGLPIKRTDFEKRKENYLNGLSLLLGGIGFAVLWFFSSVSFAGYMIGEDFFNIAYGYYDVSIEYILRILIPYLYIIIAVVIGGIGIIKMIKNKKR